MAADYDLSMAAAPQPEQSPSALQGLRQWLALPSVRRQRLMELHAGRVAVLALALQLVFLATLVAALWLDQRAAARTSADVAVAFVDKRLQELDAALERVRGRLSESGGETPSCSADLTRELVRASLDSLLVQHFWLLAKEGMQGCGPHGAGTLGELPPIPDAALALVSTRSIATELVLAMRLPDGLVLAAKLDPRALALPEGELWSAGGESADRITLFSSDQRALRLWGSAGPVPDAEPVLRLHARSTHSNLSVVVELDRHVFLSRILDSWPLAVAGAALTTLLICWWVWLRAISRSRLVLRIERALQKRQFEPFAQPIVDMATGQCMGAEVLMRWAHPERGILPPGEFIDEAERTGLIVGMSTLVMERAAHRLRPLALAHPELYFSFNVTAGQLRRPLFAAELAGIFNADTLPRSQVLLELTEREALDPQTQLTVRALHAAGWRIAIDDFGTGQSSLAALEQMPIDRLKIDRAFVSAVGEQTVRRPVLDAIIGLARELGIRLIAEGVETQAQWDYLAQRQVASVQGYLVAKPMALDAFARWFEGRLASPCSPMGIASNRLAEPVAQGPEALLRDERLIAIWRAMNGSGGLDIRDRMFHLRIYPQCFVGREAVDWLVQHEGVSRDEALRLGRSLVALGLVKHVVNEHDFQDGEYFYSVVSDPGSDAAQPAAADLTEALQGPNGPITSDHFRGLLRHRRCLRGADLVDWLCTRHGVSRATALQWGAHLMKQGRLRHVYDDRPLSDGRALFRLT